MSGEIVLVERAILSVLQPLSGSRATGQVLVRATGAPVPLPGNSYAVPIRQGAAGTRGETDWTAMIKTATAVGRRPPPHAPVPTTVTADGVLVPCFSMVGGSRQNLPAGTQVRWHPPIDGIEPVSVLSGPMTGGAPNPGPEGVAMLSSVDGWTPQKTGDQLNKAAVGNLPAVLVSWESATPQGRQKAGINRTLYNHRFKVLVVVEKHTSDHERRDDVKIILAALSELLGDRSAVDGEHFASLHVSAGEWGRYPVGRNGIDYYIYWSDFTVPHAVQRRDERTWTQFQGSRVQIVTPDNGANQPPNPPIVVVDLGTQNPT